MELEESVQLSEFAEEGRLYEGKSPQQLKLAFVDGVLREEYGFALLEEETGEVYEGVLVSVAAGAVLFRKGSPGSFCHGTVKRYAIVKGIPPSAEKLRRLMERAGFELVTTSEDLLQQAIRLMKEDLETQVVREVYQKEKVDLVVCDGTISRKVRGIPCVGYIKALKKLFLPKDSLEMLRQMPVGYRTPLVKVHYQERMEEKADKVEKYAWYVKLAQMSGLAGIARLEALAEHGVERVREWADWMAYLLPSLRSESFQDSRAPQNLQPIRGLEQFLHRYLGNPALIRRRLEEVLAKSYA